jgi:hypothetical protein
VAYKIDFKQLAEEVDILDVARHLQLTIVKDRATCPACETDRALQFFHETNSFQCHAAGETQKTDCISLYAHVKGVGMYPAAKALSELFATPTGARQQLSTTPPQKPAGGRQPAAPAPPQEAPAFDPQKFLARLEFTEQVEELGISEDDAAALGIGYTRNKMWLALRYDDGTIAGFAEVTGAKLPKNLLPRSNVVKLRSA